MSERLVQVGSSVANATAASTIDDPYVSISIDCVGNNGIASRTNWLAPAMTATQSVLIIPVKGYTIDHFEYVTVGGAVFTGNLDFDYRWNLITSIVANVSVTVRVFFRSLSANVPASNYHQVNGGYNGGGNAVSVDADNIGWYFWDGYDGQNWTAFTGTMTFSRANPTYTGAFTLRQRSGGVVDTFSCNGTITVSFGWSPPVTGSLNNPPTSTIYIGGIVVESDNYNFSNTEMQFEITP